jgi:hypothetical protein
VLDKAMSVANLAVAGFATVAVRYGSGSGSFSRLSLGYSEIESLMNGKAGVNGYKSENIDEFLLVFFFA